MLRSLQKPFTVLVEGNIGAGKSLFLDKFSGMRNVQILKEPVEKWRNLEGVNLLQMMYENPARWSLPFQTYVQLTMLEQHLSWEQPVKLMERSIFSARYCFVENLRNEKKLADSEYEVLNAWFQYLTSSPDINLDVNLIVYLKTSPEVAYERVKKRNRGEENFIPIQYIKDLHEVYEDWLVRRKFPLPSSVITIDANKDEEDMESDFLSLKELLTQVLANQAESSTNQTTEVHTN